jgi:hypothetical protein
LLLIKNLFFSVREQVRRGATSQMQVGEKSLRLFFRSRLTQPFGIVEREGKLCVMSEMVQWDEVELFSSHRHRARCERRDS